MSEVKEAVDGLGRAFEEFKTTNDANLKQRDVVLDEKLAKITATLDRYEDLNQKITLADQQRKAMGEQLDRIETRVNRPGAGGGEQASEGKAIFEKFCRKGRGALTPEEVKVLLTSDDTAGGALIAPPDYWREIIKAVVLVSPMRAIVSVRPTTQRSVQVPKRTGTFAAQWVGEIATRTEATGLAYGTVEVPTHEMTAEVYISMQELEDSAFDLQAEMTGEFSEQFGVTEGASVVNGNGVSKPWGFLQDASVTGTYVTNSGTAATIADASGQANGIIDCFHALKTAYAQRAVWTLNRATLGSVRKLQDTQKRYIWEPGLGNGIPNTILGTPYVEVPDMPSEGANAFPMAIGDFRRAYIMVDRISMAVIRDDYTKASVGQVRFVARRRIGGQVMQPEAVRLLKCHT